MKSVRLALWLWYRGDAYNGFQAQIEGPTVQGVLEAALRALGLERRVVAAGRTDRGVHARMQIVGVRAPANTDADAVAAGLARALPPTMGVAAVRRAPSSFHPQWSATGKEYRYRLLTRPGGPWAPFAWWPGGDARLPGQPLDVSRMERLLRAAVGTRDFIAFHEKSSPRRLRTLERIELRQLADSAIEVQLTGAGFARHQVRFLIGSAVATALGLIPEPDFARALDAGAPIAGLRAPAHGLTLWEVRYPEALDPFRDERETLRLTLPQGPPFVGAS